MVYLFVSHLGDFSFGSGCKFQTIRPVSLFFFQNFSNLGLGVIFRGYLYGLGLGVTFRG